MVDLFEHCIFLKYNRNNMVDKRWQRRIFRWCVDNIGPEDVNWLVVFSSTQLKFEFTTIEHKTLFALTWIQ